MEGTDAAMRARGGHAHLAARGGRGPAAAPAPAGDLPLLAHPALDVGRNLAVAVGEVAVRELLLVHRDDVVETRLAQEVRLLLEITPKDLAPAHAFRFRLCHNINPSAPGEMIAT